MPDLTVKYFNSGMTGAPQIANNWGDLVSMLDACLVNGFALKAIDTLTSAGGIATATISSGHAYRPDQVVLIAGAEQPEYNGQFRVLTTTTTNYPSQFNGYGLVSSLDFAGKVLLRNHTQLGNPVRFGLTSLNTNNGQQICGRGPTPFPNGADYSLWLLPTYVRQEDGHIRGLMPGMLWMPQDRPYSDQTIVDNVVGQAGKRFLLVRSQYSSETEGAQIAFDISGPWR